MDEANLIEESVRPPEGWWMPETKQIVHNVAESLLSKGYDYDSAQDLLTLIVSAVRKEYGD